MAALFDLIAPRDAAGSPEEQPTALNVMSIRGTLRCERIAKTTPLGWKIRM